MDANFIEYCVNLGQISQDKLRLALAKADTGMPIYEALIQSEAISQEQLAICAGEFYHCQVVDLSRVSPDPKALCYSTVSDCQRFCFIPFAVDPVAGLLVAIGDYTQVDAVTAFLREARVERMKFYIALYETLNDLIQKCYSVSLPEVSATVSGGLSPRRRPSILHTQYVDADMSHPGDLGLSQMDRKLSGVMSELAACKEDNAILRQRLEQLTATVELDAALLRELGRVLKSTGALDAQSFERWLVSQR